MIFGFRKVRYDLAAGYEVDRSIRLRTVFTMVSVHQIRGVLLEEAVLSLLRAAGYRTVTIAGSDPTLGTCAAGLTVRGRGACHQIDAVADLRIGQPFSNPQRLLVEAKAYADYRSVGLPIVRGAVGVLKDVSEFWVATNPGKPAVGRYHYQAAIFSASDFTADAQEYAFAQDIYLLPLRRSSYFRPVISALDAVTTWLSDHEQPPAIDLTDLRRQVRRVLQPEAAGASPSVRQYNWTRDFTDVVASVGRSLVATLGHAFPVFLTPGPGVDLEELSSNANVRIHVTSLAAGNAWTITTPMGDPLFTFDLPHQLFELYAQEGVLSRRAAVDLKTSLFGEFTAIYAPGDYIKVFNFKLEPDWIALVRALLREQEE